MPLHDRCLSLRCCGSDVVAVRLVASGRGGRTGQKERPLKASLPEASIDSYERGALGFPYSSFD